MTSKISSYKIAKEDLRQRSWLIALSFLGNFLALPVCFLLNNRWYQNTYPLNIEELVRNYCLFFQEDSLLYQNVVLIAGALMVGICGCDYLYSRQKSDLFHAMPVKRQRFFWIQWLNGFLIWLVPMVLCNALTLLIILFYLIRADAFAYIGPIALSSLKIMGILTISYLSVYHLCLVCAGFCGNALNTLCSTLLFGFAALIVYELINFLCSNFFDTFVSLPIQMEQVIWASPLGNSFYFPWFLLNLGSSAGKPSAFYLVMTFLVLLGSLGLAFRLFQVRPSELAEHGIHHPSIQHTMRWIIGFIGSLCGIFFFRNLVLDDAAGWYLFGAVLFGCLAFGVMDIIMQKNFRSFFSHKWEMAGCILFSCLFIFSFVYDWTGFDERLPSKSRILSVSVEIPDYCDQSYGYTSDANGSVSYHYRQDLPDIHYTDTDLIYALLERGRDNSSSEVLPADYPDYGVSHFTISVKQKNGMSFKRNYVITDRDRDLIRPILETEEFRKNYYPLSCGELGVPESIEISNELTDVVYLAHEKEDIQNIMEAYQKDFLGHYSLDELDNGCFSVELFCNFKAAEDPSNSNSERFRLNVYDDFTNTLSAIRAIYPELGLSLEDFTGEDDSLYGEALDYIDFAPYLGLTDLENEIPYTMESLGSYFGLQGYPDYQDYLAKQDGGKQEPSTQELKRLSLIIDAKEDLLKLAPCLHAGYLKRSIFGASQTDFIAFGNGIMKNGQSFECFVKKGELPEEWIARLLQEGDWEWGASYDEYEYTFHY